MTPTIANLTSASPSVDGSLPTASTAVTKRKRLSRKERKQQKRQKSGSQPPAPPSQQQPQGSRPSTLKDPQQPPPAAAAATSTTAAETKIDYLANYIPTPLRKKASSKKSTKSSAAASLGKWFPKGRVLKPATPPPLYSNAPTATTTTSITTISDPPLESALVLFYQYVPSSQLWSTSRVDDLMDYLQDIFEHLHQGLGGRIRVSREGVNATISAMSLVKNNNHSSPSNTTTPTTTSLSASHLLRHFAQDLIQFDPIFQQTEFKYIDHLPADRHFKDLKILPVQKLVYYGGGATTTTSATVPGAASTTKVSEGKESKISNKQNDDLVGGATHVEPVKFHQLMEQDDAVVIDVRNHYEAAIGRFAPPAAAEAQQQQQQPSQEEEEEEKYIDPRMRKSTDWMTWIQQPSTQEKLRNKTVLMYCTGGIRCEKASVYLEQAVGKQVKGIYQLQGGIERYMQEFASSGGGYWKGRNFVFDKREAVSNDQREGVGGVYRKPATATEGKDDTASSDVLPTSYCCLCQKPWDRYLGKKKCDTCGVPVLMCETCLTHHSSKKKKTKTTNGDDQAVASEKKKPATTASQDTAANLPPLARCPLCVEENVTVPAALVEYTDNGKKSGKWIDPSEAEGGGGMPIAPATLEMGNDNGQHPKVAPSVCKWGGGHAAEKKVMRRLKRKPCHFGAECVRKDCFFAHPDRD